MTVRVNALARRVHDARHARAGEAPVRGHRAGVGMALGLSELRIVQYSPRCAAYVGRMHSPRKSLHASAAIAACLLGAPLAHAATLAEALSAYRNNRVPEAETMLEAVANDPAASDGNRAAARLELGRIDWLVRGETDGTDASLAQASTDESRCSAVLLALRVYREAPQAALVHADQSRGACTEAQAEEMRVALARARMTQARLDAPNAAQHLGAAAAELGAIDPIARRAPSVAAANLALALMQRDNARAFTAWRDYFWLDDGDAPQAMAAYTGRIAALFNAGLAPAAVEADRIALVDLLIRAGFTDDARALAGAMSDAPAWRSARAYFTFHTNVRDATLRANREMAAGGDADWYEGALQAAMGALMHDAGLSGEPRAALREAYGLYGTTGETSGYPSLHGGHLARDEFMHVAQYGREGALRFIVIDNMLANGFESWLWDGWAEAGGWATDDGAIVQVRSSYTDGPLTALRRSRPGAERDRFVAEIERAAIGERAALGRDGLAELPATSDRLELQAIDQIAARVGGDPAAFIAAHWEAVVGYSIVLHEGRHALDKANGRFSTADLEYRAKLSQIALSETPRLGLATVVGTTIGDTPHGRANRRVLEGYRAWMRRHHGEIAGFDARLPALSQLHLLTDGQIRAIAAGLDPWAR